MLVNNSYSYLLIWQNIDLCFSQKVHWRLDSRKRGGDGGRGEVGVYIHVSFVEFILMKVNIIVFDFGEWVPLLTFWMHPFKLGPGFNSVQNNPAAYHSISNIHDIETLNDASKSSYNLNVNKFKPGYFKKSYGVMGILFFHQFLYLHIIIELKTNRWLRGQRSNVSNYCNKSRPVKCLMFIECS